jgi:hypothetical protein
LVDFLHTVAVPASGVPRLSFTHANPVIQFLERQVAAHREALDRTEQEIQTFRLDKRIYREL